MDYLSLKAAVHSMADLFRGARLGGIQRLGPWEVILRFRRGPEAVLSIDPDRPGIFIAPRGEIPAGEGGSFTDALASHLGGTVLSEISLPLPGDRIVRMVFTSGWPRRAGASSSLILEVMGRHSNLILLDAQDHIIAPMKPVPSSRSRVRPLIPGRRWSPPPARDGIPIETAGLNDIPDLSGPSPERALMGAIRGLSPVTARLVTEMAGNNRENVAGVLSEILRSCDGSRGSILQLDGRSILIPFQLGDLGGVTSQEYPDFPAAALAWRGSSTRRKVISKVEDDLESLIGREMDHVKRELAGVEREMERCLDHGIVRLKADTLLAHLNQVRRGQDHIEFPHPHRPGETLTIEINPALPPSDNVSKLFEEARRMKRGLAELQKRRHALLGSSSGLTEALSALRSGDPEPARVITADIIRTGGIKGSKAKVMKKGPGRRYRKDGFVILVGRSATDNERVTFKAAGPHDLWMHTRDYAGSHVVILTEKRHVPENVVRYAASLASKSSQAKGDPTVDVMVTERKWVRKLKGGRPGQVRVERFRSVFVKPGKR